MRTTLLSLVLTLPILGLACGDKDGDSGGSDWGDGGSTDADGGSGDGGTDGGSGDGGTDGGSGDGGTDGGSGDGGTDGGSGDGGTDGGSGDGGTDGGSGDGGSGDGGTDGGSGDGGTAVNMLANPGFEDGWDGSWAIFPEALTNYAVVADGDEIFGSKTDTWESPEGTHSLKVYGQFTGWENETPIYQQFDATVGQTYTLTGWVYHHPDDPISGTTYGALAIKFFTADYSGFDMQESAHFTAKSATGEWVELTATGEVPKGFSIAQAAVEYWHCFGETEGDCYDGGAMYVDNLFLTIE